MTSLSSSSNPSLLCEPLYHEECVVMLAHDHPLARSRTVSLSQLVHETWILTDLCETAMEEERLASSCRAAGVQPKLLRPTDWHSVFPLVASGAGISLVPAALQTSRRPELRFVPLSPATQIAVNLIRRREDTSPYLLQFLEHTTQAVAARLGTSVGAVTLGSATRKIPTAHHAAARGIMRRVAVQMPVPALQVSRPAGRERSRLVLRRAG
jgi:DNA-binding transcriptional LysR family regulator